MPPATRNAAPGGLDLAALDAITEAVESAAGLPEVVRAAARALDASLSVSDAAGAMLAVAARSPADERSLQNGTSGVTSVALRLGETTVGQLRMRAKTAPGPSVLRLVTTLIASEVERAHAPGRATAEAAGDFLRAIATREIGGRDELIERGKELGLELGDGASMIVARAHPQVPTEEGWRTRVLGAVERGARAVASRSIAGLSDRDGVGAEILLLVPSGDEGVARRASEAVLRELDAGLAGYTFALGRSRVAEDAADLGRAVNEALLAANVVEGNAETPMLAFD